MNSLTRLKSRLLDSLERSGGWRIHRIETVSLFGQPCQVIRGTLRSGVDYDDAWLVALGREARVVFDVGCNIGQSGVLLLCGGHVQRIVMIDPNPIALSQAAENLFMNGWAARSRFVCAFAAERSDDVQKFYTVGAGAAGSMFADFAKTASGLGASSLVPTVTLDELVETQQLIPDLIKVDVEGAEGLVLQGATGLAGRRTARFFVEMHSGPHLSMTENAARVLDWCRQAGYRAWYLKLMSELTDSAQIAGRGRCHLLLLPAGVELPASLLSLEQGAPLAKVQLSSSQP